MSKIRRFVEGEAFARIRAAKQVLRELEFITALPAAEVLAAQGSTAPDTAPEAQVLVQGIADLVLVYPDHLELLGYKTAERLFELERIEGREEAVERLDDWLFHKIAYISDYIWQKKTNLSVTAICFA